MLFLMVFDSTQFWLDGRPGNEYFWIFHKISGLLTPPTPLSVYPQWFETTIKHIWAIPPTVYQALSQKLLEAMDLQRATSCYTRFSAISPNESYLPLFFRKNAIFWGYFQNICLDCFWGLWGQKRPHGQVAGFWDRKEIKINVKNQISNFVYLLYCHFPTRNKSKSPLKNQKKSPRDYIGKGAFTMWC